MLARNNLIHRIAHGFQPLELLDLANHGRLTYVDLRSPSAQNARQPQKTDPGRQPHERPHQNDGKNRAQ